MFCSGGRESNPPSWLGKPEHYHYANPANRVGLRASGVIGHTPERLKTTENATVRRKFTPGIFTPKPLFHSEFCPLPLPLFRRKSGVKSFYSYTRIS